MTCRSRSSRTGVALLVSILPLSLSAAASAADLPPIRTSAANQVADCATPGRLMAYLRQRNPKLDPRFGTVGSEYMRHGEALGVRWDYAFFQMILETGYLAYSGDVKADQNNFAGLGATGKGARGERFADISTGVRAHIEHLVMYSGERVESPVAERTRNIQDWGVLTSWQQSLDGPATFADLATKWAPTSRRYATDIQTIAERFFNGPCLEPDPETGLVASAGGAASATAGEAAKQRAIEAAQAEGGTQLAALGAPPASESQIPTAAAAQVAAAASEAKPVIEAKADAPAKVQALPKAEAPNADAQPKADMPAKAQTAAMTPPITLLNPTAAATEPVADKDAAAAGGSKAEAPASATAKTAGKDIEVAALPSGALKEAGKPEKKKEPQASGKCRVWTASYGGTKAIIIKALRDKTVNYTVLDVNEGAEKRETDAYINAYAKGGEAVGEFPSQSQALEKAFELCPEG